MGRAADSSLMETAEEQDVLEEIEVLRELAVKSKKADVSIPELLAAARLSAHMKKLDLSPVEIARAKCTRNTSTNLVILRKLA